MTLGHSLRIGFLGVFGFRGELLIFERL